VLEWTDAPSIREVVDRAFARLGRIDVIISNAGYGLFGAAEELTDEQVHQIVATNLLGSISTHSCCAATPSRTRRGTHHPNLVLWRTGCLAGNSLYHATKWGIEGFVESVAQEVRTLSYWHNQRRAWRRPH